MTCAFMNSWGVSAMYIASYLHSHDSSVTVNQVDFLVTLTSLAYGVGLIVSVYLVDCIGPRLTAFIGTLLMTTGFCALAWITHAWTFVLVFGLFIGLGFGLNFLTGNNVAMRHFTYNRGKVLGFCVSGNGFGSILFGLTFTFIVNPQNSSPNIRRTEGSQVVYYFDSDISSRTPYALIASGLIILVIGTAGALLLRVRTPPPITLTDNDESEILSQGSDDSDHLSMTVGEVMRTGKFWKMLVALYCGMAFPMWVFTSFKSFGSLYIDSDHYLTFIGAVGSVMNGVARALFPFLLDYISFFTVNKCSLVIEAGLAFSIFYAVQNPTTYLVVVTSTFFMQGSQFFPFSLLCIHEYGPILGPRVFSYLAWGSTIANAMPGIYYWLVVKNAGFLVSFIGQGLQVLLGLCLTISLSAAAKKKQDFSEINSKQSFAR
jgi:MFS family permease